MMKSVELTLTPMQAADDVIILSAACNEAGIQVDDVQHWIVARRSIDARGRNPKIVLLINLYIDEELPHPAPINASYKYADSGKRIIIIGAGPAGYFAALECLEYGIKPIVLERGKDAQARRRDLRAIQQFGIVNPDSNYCFGEGGAGTYSDGKLYTNSKKRGDIEKVLKILVEHGAHERILVDTHPHIGSNKLPKIIQNIRSTIEQYGGEVHFNMRVTDFIMKGHEMIGAVCNDVQEFVGDAVILATGHSARDIFTLLRDKKILIESKPFALGVRAEHPQELIDEIQYKQSPRDPFLPAASYKLVTQVQGRGVFSFCMCPGGLIVPAATAPGEIVVNGMSMSRRDSAFANSGIVVAIESEDIQQYQKHGPLAGMALQAEIEQKVFSVGDGSQKAPAQKIEDFINNKTSASLPKSSYIPGLYSANLHTVFPQSITARLQKAFLDFGKKMRGYIHPESVIVATESRTSSPVRIPRNAITREHPEVKNLYPVGEGAGYAGGIMSAAMDGQNTTKAIAQKWELNS